MEMDAYDVVVVAHVQLEEPRGLRVSAVRAPLQYGLCTNAERATVDVRTMVLEEG